MKTDSINSMKAPRKAPVPVGSAMQAVTDLAAAIQAGWMPTPEEAVQMTNAVGMLTTALKGIGIDAGETTNATTGEMARAMRDGVTQKVSGVDDQTRVLNAEIKKAVTSVEKLTGRKIPVPVTRQDVDDALVKLGKKPRSR